jgi:hypothetical protein
MDDERDQAADGVTRTHGRWLWLIGIALTAATFYWAFPAGSGHPTTVTVFGINEPATRIASYPGLRVRPLPQGQMATAELVR